MDLEDSSVKGSVLIVHQIHEGKHQYEVEHVVKYKTASGGKAFVRGDKLVQVNGFDLQELTPDELAHMLVQGSPMLTVHKSAKMKDPAEPPCPAEDFLYPVSEETRFLSFSMEMRREGDQEEGEGSQEGGTGKNGETEGSVCRPEDEEKDVLIVSMTKTSIAVVRGRGCATGDACQGCHGTGCTLNDVVVVAESSMVTLVPRGGNTFREGKNSTVLVEHVASQKYLRGICSQQVVYVSPNPEKITIYTYRSTSSVFEGMPVVLNMTGSNCFLRCCKEGQKVLLKVETCEKQRLKKISTSDMSTLSFIFYMKSDGSTLMFESGLHRGWFIEVADTNMAGMRELDAHRENPAFLFIIKK